MADLRFALRRLGAAPSFAAVAVLTLALGIGGAASMFSLVYSIILRPLEYREPERLASIHITIPKAAAQYPELPVNVAHCLAWRRDVKEFEGVGLVESGRVILTEGGRSERITRGRITANLFALVGARPARGRLFVEGEDEEGKDRVVILSDRFWRSRFQADPAMVGRKILLNEEPYEVVGIMPARFPFPDANGLVKLSGQANRAAADLWKPMGFTRQELANALGNFNMAAIARLRPGVSFEAAQSALTAQAREFARTFPQPLEVLPVLTPLQSKLVGEVRLPLILLTAAMGFVLLIVCTNLANLMLARASARRREVAVRAALGASPAQLIRETAAEAMVLAGAGGALGIGFAYAVVAWAVNQAPVELPRLAETRVDGWVLGFCAAVSVACAVLVGLIPGWRAARVDPQEALRSASRGTEGPGGGWTRSALVAAEVALSITLVVGAGLLLHSFYRIMNIDAVARTAKVVAAEVQLPFKAYREPSVRRERWREAERKLAGLPGVLKAGLVSALPITTESDVSVAFAGNRARPPISECPPVNFRSVSPDYFAAMGIDIVAGRAFQAADGAAPLVVISRNLAARLWPGEDPIGKPLGTSFSKIEDSPPTVIGVAADLPMGGLTDKLAMTAYLSYERDPPRGMSLVARTINEPSQLAGPLRELIARLDAQIPAPRVRTMEAVVSDSLAHRRFQMGLLGLFAAVSLALACLGIYGVVSYSVGLRTNEIGIRMALGAKPAAVRRLVLMQSMRPVAAGAGLGMAGAFVLSRFMQSLVYGVSVTDPLTYGAGLALLGLVAAAACLIPARRAARLDPLAALRA